MKKIVILIGGARFNRGSEAMVRGCVRMLREEAPNRHIVLSSQDDSTGSSLSIDGVDRYVKRFVYKRSNKLLRMGFGVLRRIFNMRGVANRIEHATLLKECKDADLVVMTAGDNYDAAYNIFKDMHSMNKTIRKVTEAKMLFFNCSINPDELNDDIFTDLAIFDKVTIRESITLNAVKDRISPEKLDYYPDIAFVMQPKEIELPKCFSQGEVVGVNLSPLILRQNYTDSSEQVLEAYYKIVEYVINELGKQILLIPHVMNGKDLSVLRGIYDKYKDTGKVFIIENENLTAPELKYIISNCELFFGARTHATIAAYSSCVPTLVLGYSVKSRGFATDIFGGTDGHVVSVQDVADSEALVESFKQFVSQSDQVRKKLEQVIPGLIEKAESYKNYFTTLLDDGGNAEDTK